MRNKGLIFCLLITFLMPFLSGCASSYDSFAKPDEASKFQFENVMRVPIDCTKCSNAGGDNILINGALYHSDTAIKCCLRANQIDTNIALKKVYIHRIVDTRENAEVIKFINENGTFKYLSPSFKIEALFFMFLEQDLKSRGIIVSDTQATPYTYKLDFSIGKFFGTYNQKTQTLNSQLEATLNISDINLNKEYKISTKQNVSDLSVRFASEFDFFTALLIKQAASKVAFEISKL